MGSMKLVGVCGAMIMAFMSGSALAEPKSAEVIHYWTSPDEVKGLKVIVDAFEAAGGKWVDNAVASQGGDQAVAAAMNRMIAGKPPEAFLLLMGAQLNDLADQGALTDLSEVAAAEKWRSLLSPTVIGAISRNDKIYAIPTNVQSDTIMYVNLDVLKKAGLAPPKDWDEFFATADKLKAAGITPIAWGGQSWQETIAFITTLLSKGGPDLYRKIIIEHDEEAVKSQQFRDVLVTFGKLKTYVDPASVGRDWNVTANIFSKGDAAFQFLGDWAQGQYLSAGLKPGENYACTFGPGSQNVSVLGNVLVFPQKDGASDTQDLLARTVFSAKVQHDFALARGTIPARSDVDQSGFTPCQKIELEAIGSGKTVAAPEIALSSDLLGSLRDAVADYWSDPEHKIDAMVGSVGNIITEAKAN